MIYIYYQYHGKNPKNRFNIVLIIIKLLGDLHY